MKHLTSKGIQIIAVLTMLGVAAVLLIQCFGPFPRQMQTWAVMRQHLPTLEAALHQDPRFTNIVVYPSSGCTYSLHGELTSEKDLEDLKRIVAATHPPVPTFYQVAVIPPELQAKLEASEPDTKP